VEKVLAAGVPGSVVLLTVTDAPGGRASTSHQRMKGGGQKSGGLFGLLGMEGFVGESRPRNGSPGGWIRSHDRRGSTAPESRHWECDDGRRENGAIAGRRKHSGFRAKFNLSPFSGIATNSGRVSRGAIHSASSDFPPRSVETAAGQKRP